MNRQSRNIGFMVMVVIVFGIAALVLQPSTPSIQGSMTMLNVGQGDSFLITAPSGAQLLIDGGKDSKVLTELAKAMPAGDHSIDVVMSTHPDSDHIGGLGLVLERYTVGLYLTSQVVGDSGVFRDLNNTLSEKGIASYYVRRGMTLALDDTTSFKILFPDRDTTGWETNTASVVGRVQIGNASAIINGDSPISIEHYLVQKSPQDLDVDIMKLGHHGSKTSSSEEYLRTASPTLALISAGVNNSYGHPHAEVLAILNKLKISFVSTQQHGQVIFTTDGEKWVQENEK